MTTGPRPTLIVIATGIAVALSLFGDMAMYVILPAQNTALGFSAIQVGLLLSVNRWIRLVTNQVAQRLIRRSGTRIAFPMTLALGSLLTVGYALMPAFGLLLLLRMTWGACWSIIRHTGIMTTSSIAGSGRRGRSMGIYIALVNAGFIAGTFTAGWLYDWGGYHRAFFIAAALSLAALPAAFSAGRGKGHHPDVSCEPPGVPETGNGRQGIGFTLTVRGFVISFVGSGLIMATLGYMLRVKFGDSVTLGSFSIGVTALTGMLLSVRSIINFAGSPAAGALLDRVGNQRATRIGFAVSGSALLTAAVFGTTAIIIPMILIFFIGSMVARLGVESHAAQMGHRPYAALATSTDLGSAIGPLLGWLGIELSRSGSVFWIGGTLLLAAACLRQRFTDTSLSGSSRE